MPALGRPDIMLMPELSKRTPLFALNSVSFYKAEGYSEGPRGMHATTSGLQIACVHMEKDLAGHI